MIPQYAKALLSVYAKRMRDIIHEVQSNLETAVEKADELIGNDLERSDNEQVEQV